LPNNGDDCRWIVMIAMVIMTLDLGFIKPTPGNRFRKRVPIAKMLVPKKALAFEGKGHTRRGLSGEVYITNNGIGKLGEFCFG